MRFKTARFSHFRNIDYCELNLDQRDHFMFGVNGQGKSNCLEGIGFISALRSFRTQITKPLFQKGYQEFVLLYELEHKNLGHTEVEIKLSGNQKLLFIDGDQVKRMSDFIGLFPVVPLHSGDLMILRGAPSERRRFFDLTLASVDTEFFRALRLYSKSLIERNRLLKLKSESSALAAFEKDLARYAFVLTNKRTAMIDRMNEILTTIYGSFSEHSETPRLKYEPNVLVEDSSAYEQIFRENRQRDQLIGSTQKGPHRDDYSLSLSVGGAKEYASDGQQRGLCVALRLAQAKYFEELLNIKPVLLIDDILGELDPKRTESFWAACPKDLQIIASGTEYPKGIHERNWAIWDVANGVFQLADSI